MIQFAKPCVLPCVLIALSFVRVSDGADFHELMKYVPDGANAIITLNVEKTYASEYAKKEGWDFVKGQTSGRAPLKLPLDSKHVVLAAQMDFEYMRPVWETGAYELGIDPSMDFVAKRAKGTLDKIAGQDAVETPNDSIIVKFAPSIFGAMKPANRQSVARWIQEVGSRDGDSLSPYLKQAATYPDRVGTEIVFALDLQDVLRESDIRKMLAGSEVLKKANADLDAAAKTLASARGITLGVRVTDRVFGKIKIDFGGDTASIANVAKPLFLEILGEAGASIDEMEEWKPRVETNQVSLEGTLTSSGLLRVFSFFEHDGTAIDDDPEKIAASSQPAEQPMSDEEKVPYATKEYYDSVNLLLKDLSRERGAKSFGQIGLWFQKYAKRIDALPILNVDPEMVNFGMWTSAQLRNGLAAIQNVGIQSAAREAQVYSQPSGTASWGTNFAPVARYGWGGGYRMYGSGYGTATWDVQNISGERRAIRAEEKGKGSSQARAIVQDINNAQQEVRQKMTEKYKIEF